MFIAVPNGNSGRQMVKYRCPLSKRRKDHPQRNPSIKPTQPVSRYNNKSSRQIVDAVVMQCQRLANSTW